MVHMISASLLFLVFFAMIQVVLFRHLNDHEGSSRYHRSAVKGVALVAVMGLAWMYSVEVFDLSHPGVQIPIGLRIAYTYIISALGITFLGMWIHSERVADSERQQSSNP